MGEPLHEAAFTALYERHYAALLRYAVRRVGEVHARDVVAETFMVAWRRRTDMPAEEPLPWLYRTAANVLANEYRKGVRATELRGKLELRVVSEHSDQAVDASGDRLDRTLSAMQRLSESDQEVLRLHAWEGLDGGELADALECSRPAATVRLHRARKRLRQVLDAQPEHPDPPRSVPGSTSPTTSSAVYAATDQYRKETS